MAFIDVPPPPAGGSRFLDFAKTFRQVGDQFAGLIKGHREGTYGQDFEFELAGMPSVGFTAKGHLKKQLIDAASKVIPGKPALVVIQVKSKTRGTTTDLLNFNVKVDPEWAKGPPRPTANTALKEPKGGQSSDFGSDDDVAF